MPVRPGRPKRIERVLWQRLAESLAGVVSGLSACGTPGAERYQHVKWNAATAVAKAKTRPWRMTLVCTVYTVYALCALCTLGMVCCSQLGMLWIGGRNTTLWRGGRAWGPGVLSLGLSLPGKVYSGILERRVHRIVKPWIQEEQCGFRPGRRTVDKRYTLSRVLEGAWKFA